jgi:hypothetical protein
MGRGGDRRQGDREMGRGGDREMELVRERSGDFVNVITTGY